MIIMNIYVISILLDCSEQVPGYDIGRLKCHYLLNCDIS